MGPRQAPMGENKWGRGFKLCVYMQVDYMVTPDHVPHMSSPAAGFIFLFRFPEAHI